MTAILSMSRVRLAALLGVVALLVASSAGLGVGPAGAGGGTSTSFVVDDSGDDSDDDPGDGDCETAGGTCTLRAAVQEGLAGPATEIDIAVGSRTIALDGAIDVFGPQVNKAFVIHGDGVDSTVLDGGDDYRHFSVSSRWMSLTVRDMTLQNGSANFGGSIQVLGGAELVAERIHFIGNSAATGGAVFGDGSGGDSADTIYLWDSTFTENSASLGGAVWADDETLYIVNSTFVGNDATLDGGAVGATNGSEVIIDLTTLARNSSGQGGGAVYAQNTASITVIGSILEDSFDRDDDASAVDNCTAIQDGTIGSAGGNVSDDDSCGFASTQDLEETAAGAGPLQDNGGPTFTAAISADSPAIDNSDNCENETDQRGLPRPVDGDTDGTAVCDAGAYEFQPEPDPTDPTTPTETSDDPDDGAAPAATAAPARPTRAQPTFTG